MPMTGKVKLAVLVPGLAALLAIAALTVAIGPSGSPALAQGSVPHAPTGLTVASSTHDSVTLSWDDPGDTSITGYQVLRRDTVKQAPGTFTTIEENTSSAATTFIDDTVSAGTRYVYRVRAINASGLSDQSNYVNVETPATPTSSPPSRPTGLAATSVSHDSVTLSWDDPGDGSITGYQVLRRYRDGDEYGDGQGAAEFIAIVDDTGSAATTYTDTSVTAAREVRLPREGHQCRGHERALDLSERRDARGAGYAYAYTGSHSGADCYAHTHAASPHSPQRSRSLISNS